MPPSTDPTSGVRMRVLIVHNRYSSRVPSGENLAVDDEARWLRAAGVDVHTHQVSNDDALDTGRLGQAWQILQAPWSLTAQRGMARAISQTRPHVVHVHNLFPLLSGSVVRTATRHGLPVIWTVHNRRLTCIAGTNHRAGGPCHACRPGHRLPGIRHACYAGSPPVSALVTGATAAFSHLAHRTVTPLAISHHMKRWLVDTAGFDAGRVRVKYNGVNAAPERTDPGSPAARHTYLAAGHLTDHKGIPLLLDAWHRLPGLDAELRIVGDGPLAPRVQAAAAADPRITWLSQVPPSGMPAHLREARAVLVPAQWDEPFGRIAAEALSFGRPVITTGTGGLKEVVDPTSGWVTGPDPAAFARAIEAATLSDEAVADRGTAGRRRYESLFSPEATTRSLIDIYESAVRGHGA